MKFLLSCFIVMCFATSLFSQVVYVHPDPEIIITPNGSEDSYPSYTNIYPSHFENARVLFSIYKIDPFDNDDDIAVRATLKGNTYYIENQNAGTADTLNFGDEIGPNSNWQWISEWDESTTILTTIEGGVCSGPWANTSSKFLGLRCIENTDTIYGWVRIRTDISNQLFEVLDYAYNSVPNQGLFAGEGMLFAVENLIAYDAYDCQTESDIGISFDIPAIEDSVSEYRIFVVPLDQTEGFDSEQAISISSEYYMQVLPTGNDVMVSFEYGTTDINGDQIIENTDYKVFVLSIYSFLGSSGYHLSESSNTIVLNSNTDVFYNECDPDITLMFGESLDIDMNLDGIRDFTFLYEGTYSSLSDWDYYIAINSYPTDADDYDLMGVICKSDNWYYAAVLNQGYNIDASCYWGIGDANLSSCYRSSHKTKYTCTTDWTNNEEYFVGVKFAIDHQTHFGWLRISISPDYQSARILDYAYNQTPLANITTGVGINISPSNIVATDNSDYNDSRDIHVSFNQSFHSFDVAEYKIMIVPTESVASFDIDAAENIDSDKYLSIAPDAHFITTILPQDLPDINGNEVEEGLEYYIYILTVMNESSCISNTLDSSDYPLLLQNTAITTAWNDKSPIKVFPNPNNGSFKLEFDLETASDIELEINNMLGQTIFKQSIKNTDYFVKDFDLDNLNSGTYIISVRFNNGVLNKRLIVR